MAILHLRWKAARFDEEHQAWIETKFEMTTARSSRKQMAAGVERVDVVQ